MSEDPVGVAVATLAASDVPIHFLSSWGSMLQYDAVHGGHVLAGGTLVLTSGPRVAEARSQIVDQFFADPLLARAEWLLMIDSDMVFGLDLIERMLAVAHPERVPVLGALCFAGGRSQAPYPTIYKEVLVEQEGQPDFVAVEPMRDGYPRDALVRVGATGAACIMIHRRVLAAMSQPWPKGFGTFEDGRKNPYPWFVEGIVGPNGEPFGEDVTFCRRLHQMQVPIHVHTGIKCGHVKHFILDEEYFDRYLAAEAVEDQPTPLNRAERRQAARKALRAS